MCNSRHRGPLARPLPVRARPESKARSRAFTLTELLLVLLIVAVLIGLLLPAVNKARMTARQVRCATTLRQLHLAVRIYADDYKTLPVSSPDKIIPHLELPQVTWRCKDDRTSAAVPLTDTKYSSYTYLGPIYMDPTPDFDLTKLKPRVGFRKYELNPLLPIFWDRDENHDKDRNIVYWNGVAEKRNWE